MIKQGALTLPQLASVQELQRNYRRLLDLVKKTGLPLFLLKNNEPEVVIVDVQAWEEMANKAREAEEMELEKAIKVGEDEWRKGKTKVLRGSLVNLAKKARNAT